MQEQRPVPEKLIPTKTTHITKTQLDAKLYNRQTSVLFCWFNM